MFTQLVNLFKWRLLSESKPKKARQIRSNIKVRLIVFFDSQGIVHWKFAPQHQTVNAQLLFPVTPKGRRSLVGVSEEEWLGRVAKPAQYYVSVLQHLRENICR